LADSPSADHGAAADHVLQSRHAEEALAQEEGRSEDGREEEKANRAKGLSAGDGREGDRPDAADGIFGEGELGAMAVVVQCGSRGWSSWTLLASEQAK
jgi:hypothetical protein